MPAFHLDQEVADITTLSEQRLSLLFVSLFCVRVFGFGTPGTAQAATCLGRNVECS